MLTLAACASAPPPPPARSPSGRELVERRCQQCHAIDLADVSRNPAAPPLRDLFRRYPIDSLDSAFRNGLEVGHRDMPRFQLQPDEISALLDYLRNLDPCASPSADQAAMRRCFRPM
jgi:mono/diheme cytochrome c family protein